MSTFEQVTVFLAVFQATLLAMYAWETFRLRRDAANQNTLIATQIENTLQQNQLMSEQLRVMADGLQFQRDCIENDDQPLFEVTVAHSNDESCSVVVESLKENIWFVEFRSNDALIKSYRNSDRHRRKFVAAGNTPRNIYLAIVYKTVRGKVATKSINTLQRIVGIRLSS